MNTLIDNANTVIDAVGDGMELEELRKEFYCEFEDYETFQDDTVTVTIDDLKRYDFTLSGCRDYLLFVTENFKEFVELFNADSPLEGIAINSEITENDIEALAKDIDNFDFSCDEYQWLKEEYKDA